MTIEQVGTIRLTEEWEAAQYGGLGAVKLAMDALQQMLEQTKAKKSPYKKARTRRYRN